MLRPAKLFASWHRLRCYVHGKIADFLHPQPTALMLRQGWGDARRRRRRLDQHHRTYRQQASASLRPISHHTQGITTAPTSLPSIQRAIQRQWPSLSSVFAAPRTMPHLTLSFARHVAGISVTQRPLTTTNRVSAQSYNLFSRFLQPLGHEAATGRCVSQPQPPSYDQPILFLSNHKIFAERKTKGMADIVYPSSETIPSLSPHPSCKSTALTSKHPTSVVYLSIMLDITGPPAAVDGIQKLDASVIQSVTNLANYYETHLNQVTQLLRRLAVQSGHFHTRWMSPAELRVYFPKDVLTPSCARARLDAMGIELVGPHITIEKEPASMIGPEYFRDIHQFLDHIDNMIENGPAFKPIPC